MLRPTLLAALLVGAPLHALESQTPAGDWAGLYSNDTLTLMLQPQGGGFSGSLSLQQLAFPVRLVPTADSLTGAYQAQGAEFPVSVTRRPPGIAVAVDGMVIVLPRSTGAAASAGAGGAGPGAVEPGGAGPGGRLDDGTPLGQQWVQILAGQKATRMSSYSSGDAGGYSSRTDVHLCSTGEFAILDRSSVTVDVGGAFGNSFGSGTDRGRWRILTQGPLAGIELQYANGQIERYRLERRGNQTYVEGERWLITPSGACR